MIRKILLIVALGSITSCATYFILERGSVENTFVKIETASLERINDGGVNKTPLIPISYDGNYYIVVFLYPTGNSINGKREVGLPIKKLVFEYPSGVLIRIDDVSPSNDSTSVARTCEVTIPENADWRMVADYRDDMQRMYSHVIPAYFEGKNVPSVIRADFEKKYFMFTGDFVEQFIRKESPHFFEWLRSRS